MKDYLKDICEELGYKNPRNLSGITLDMILEAASQGSNMTNYLRECTGCCKATTTTALRNTFPDRDPIKDSNIRKWLLNKKGLKLCTKCGNVKNTTQFYGNTSKKDGIGAHCKICSAKARRGSYAKDPEKEKSKNRVRKINRDTNQTPSWANLEDIEIFYRNRPAGYPVDHIIPLNGRKVSGLHVLGNLQYLTVEENLKKAISFNTPMEKLVISSDFQSEIFGSIPGRCTN